MFASRTNWPLKPNRFTIAVEQRRSRTNAFVDLTISNPTTCGFLYPENRLVSALSDRRALRYEAESKGLLSARQAISRYYDGRPALFGAGRSIGPQAIVITSGTSEAYDYVFRLLCEPGDEVLVPSPSYPLFEYLSDLADVRAVPYRLFYDHGWHIDFSTVKSAATGRSRAVIVVHPNNPTGSFVKVREAQQLSEICARHDLAIIADEVFLDYSDLAEPEATFAFGSAALTFTLSGISKISLLPQMKIGWIVTSGPEKLATSALERLEVIADTYLSPSTPAQLALPEMLAVRTDLQTQMRQRIRSNLKFLDSVFNGKAVVTRLNREGGWYAVLRVPATRSDEDVAIALLEECGVLVHPGHFFDFPQDGFLIVSLIGQESEFQKGISALQNFFAASGA